MIGPGSLPPSLNRPRVPDLNEASRRRWSIGCGASCSSSGSSSSSWKWAGSAGHGFYVTSRRKMPVT